MGIFDARFVLIGEDKDGKGQEAVDGMNRMFGAFKKWSEEHPIPAKQTAHKNEKSIERCIGESLEAQGIEVCYQVACEAGRADIVTPDAIYEIKDTLDRGDIFSAIGQVSIYRQQINPEAKAYVVGRQGVMTAKQRDAVVASALQMGVEILFWK